LSLIVAPTVYFLSAQYISYGIEILGIILIATGIYRKSKSLVKAVGISLSVGLAAVILTVLLAIGLITWAL
jgi:hypothetical protein